MPKSIKNVLVALANWIFDPRYRQLVLTLLWDAGELLLLVSSSTNGWGSPGWSTVIALSQGIAIVPVTGESAEQEQDDFKTTIIYCAGCHCKLRLKVLFLLRHSSFLLQALPLNSADILKRTGTEGVQWGLGSISRQTRLKWLQAQCAFLPRAKEKTVVAKGIGMVVDFGKKPVVFAFHRRESLCTDWYIPKRCYRPI